MVFSSIIFLFFFLPIVLLIYFTTTRNSRNLFLLFASLVFYFWGEGQYVIVLIAYMVYNYYFGVYIGKYKEWNTAVGDRKARAILILSLCFNLGVFALFKYFNFVMDNISYLVQFFGMTVLTPRVHLPIGISFFAFQAVSYVIDVYRRDVKAQGSLVNFSMYNAMFTQLIAGPIVRYRDVVTEVVDRTITINLFFSGVHKFIIGLGKKVIIANTLASVADQAFSASGGDLSVGAAWLGVICYGLQIYFDFSGYSDMAIGLGRMFGFHFLENFNYPYIAGSVRDFWKRWHISLSTWFRDYLYIPLGGNRVEPARIYLNLLLVFFLCGLWHGASWTFVIWGLWHGAFLVLERTKWGNFIERAPKLVGCCYTLLVVLVGWVFFRAETLGISIHYLKTMFGFQGIAGVSAADLLNTKTMIVLLCGLVGCTPAVSRLSQVLMTSVIYGKRQSAPLTAFLKFTNIVILFLMLVICAALLSSNIYNPFIYFRF